MRNPWIKVTADTRPRDYGAFPALIGYSPSGANVLLEMVGSGLEVSLYVLHRHAFHAAVSEVLQVVSFESISHQALADFLSAYGMHERLAALCQVSIPATEYVLALWELDPDAAGPEVAENVSRAQDVARAVAARRAATEAILAELNFDCAALDRAIRRQGL